MTSVRRSAFTLMDLSVLIVIIDILVGLFMPAVQAARKVARRTQCLSYIKQLGPGRHNFQSPFNTFPAGYRWRAHIRVTTSSAFVLRTLDS